MNIYKIGDVVKTRKPHPCGSVEWEILRVGLDYKLKCKRLWTHFDDTKRKSLKNDKIIFGDFRYAKEDEKVFKDFINYNVYRNYCSYNSINC